MMNFLIKLYIRKKKNNMKKIKSFLIILLSCCIVCLFAGCGKDGNFYWSHWSAIEDTNNEYFKTKVIYKDAGGSRIIQNEVTGEYFFVVSGVYGISMCPIETVNEKVTLNEIAVADGMQGGGWEP